MPLADRKPRRPAQYEVLANAADELGQFLGDRAARAGIGHLLQRLDVAIAGNHERRDGANERLKQLITGDEIGLGIDLNDRPRSAARRSANQPVSGDPSGLFCRRGEALFAQPVDRGLDIAAGIAQRPLAVHHPGAGALAQFLDQRRRYLGHRIILS